MLITKRVEWFAKKLIGATSSARYRRVGFAFIFPTVLYFALIFFYPLYQSFQLSFYEGGLGQPEKFVGLKSYEKILTDPFFWHTVKNTLTFVIFSVPPTVVLALIVALLLNRIKSQKFRDVLSASYFTPVVTSLVAAALIWGWIYQPLYGLLNGVITLLGFKPQKWLSSPAQVMPSLAIINIWLRVGFETIIFLAAIQSIPERYKEAARIDGANDLQVFRYITLPFLNNQIIMVFIIEMIFAFKVFDQVFVTTEGGPANASRVVMMYLYDTAFKWFRLGDASVVAIFIFVSLLTMSILQWIFFRKATD